MNTTTTPARLSTLQVNRVLALMDSAEHLAAAVQLVTDADDRRTALGLGVDPLPRSLWAALADWKSTAAEGGPELAAALAMLAPPRGPEDA